ncbi:ABC transporter permease [Spiroplasma sp. NBRC 100390]|uniref:ABC transporter permease n=1 Tax=unclassified Spiroplasma TaxID=2637901 RepID=UPI0008929056|nr:MULTISPECIES: ABC transporter permease [unclassified Spiroplasma]AOX43797.1 ABC transporter permease [Spiroplasma sp. TU-14]APE13267.1 ABC transporter permease [Spiroplasma sp. NBRC 100390]
MTNRVLRSGKSNSWWSLISFSIFKIRRSMAVWVLFILSVVLFGAIAITLFSSSKNVYEFFKNFQYGVFIFNNILLLLFILLVIIKIFGREFEDGTYLLLISKPYSRFVLFLLKLIALWILIILFLGTIILFAFGIGYLGNIFNKDPEYLRVYQNLLLKLFLYSMTLSFFASSGILFAVTFLNSQVVLLIVVIFCSLFLVGGMPYSLIMSLAKTVELSFANDSITQNYPVPIIKSTINFKKNLKKDLIKYPHLTNAIWNFYDQWSYNDLNTVFKNDDYKDITSDPTLRVRRLEFYKSLGLTVPKEEEFEIKTLKGWDSSTRYLYDGKLQDLKTIILNVGSATGKDVSMKVNFATDYFFKSEQELDQNDPIQKELADYMKVVLKAAHSWQPYISMNLYSGASSLFYFNRETSYYSLSAPGDSKLVSVDRKLSEGNAFNPTDVFTQEYQNEYKGQLSDYNNGSDFREWILDYFDIPTLFVLREIEIDLLKKIMDYKLLEEQPIKITSEWIKYDDLMNTYGLISKFNIIEHWNQIWTASLNFTPYWFEPLQRSNIDFDVQNNYLMSYQDFRLSLGADKKIDVNPAPFLNISLIQYIYLALSGVFLICSYLILRRKNIT